MKLKRPGDGILHIVVPVEGEVPVAELIGYLAADKAEYDKVAAGGAAPAAAPAAAQQLHRQPRHLLQQHLFPRQQRLPALPESG